MKTNIQKLKIYLCMTSFLILCTLTSIKAVPKFDNAEAQSAAKGILDPLTTFALWAVPVTTAVVLLIAAIMWLAKDEDEKENKPFLKTVKKILTVAIIAELVPTLLKIFGIS